VKPNVVEHLREVAAAPDFAGTRYRPIRPIGRGGMGEVWLAEDVRLRREVAVKVLAAEASSEALRDRLVREAQVLARIEHPSIVPVHDVGLLADGRAFYAMKLVRGQRLDRWLASEPPRPAALRLFQRICEAVAFAHAHGVIHRDLKPQNVMVGEFGEALVMDWGLAKSVRDPPPPAELDGAASLPAPPPTQAVPADPALAPTVVANLTPRQESSGATIAGTVLGTPAYMSPEQARGEIDRLDERTDVYALGAILHFLLAGRPPFEGSADEVLRRTREEPAPRPSGAPRPLASICARAMAREPAARYENATAMAEDVGRFLDGLTVSAHRETPAEQAARIASKYRVILLLLAAYLALRVVLLVAIRR
jgi:eukaryotic-like serine/threonine-protein kinase